VSQRKNPFLGSIAQYCQKTERIEDDVWRKAVLHVPSNLDKKMAERQSLDNGEGVRLFVEMEMLLPAIEDAFAFEFDCSQPGREHLITRKRVSAVEGLNPRVSQIC
jgi:hypothetical protein